jgi:pimeloyl-ACP methyl ester carboxylesterase
LTSIWFDLLGSETVYRGKKYRTRVIEAGEGEPLILMHGIGGHAEAYSRNLVRLGKTCRAMSIDLIWHGLSSKPAFDPRTIPMYADQVLDLMDSIGAERAALEGESLGGWIAAWMALHHPDRISKLVLNTSAGVVFKQGKVQLRPDEGTNLLRDRSIAAVQNPDPVTIRKRLEWLMAKPDRVTDELVDIRCAFYSEPATRKALTSVFDAAFTPGSPGQVDRIPEDELRNIRVPTLVLWSDKNPGAGEDVGKYKASLIPGSQYYCIKDAAHWPQWEKPEEHDRVVTAFLAGKSVG